VRAAIYARVSTTANQSVEMQLRDLRELAARRGLEIVEEYCDEGVSGSKDSRPGLNRLLADAEAGKFSVVLVWKLDRLGRSLIHLVRLMENFQRLGIELVSFSEGLDFTTTTGKLLYQIISAFAEFERDCIRERVRAGMRNAKAKGKRIGRPPRTWLSEETRKDIALAYQRHEGSLRQLATRYGTSAGTVQRCVASYRSTLARAA
jgi:DNA invertase Pin-like site-specific DNA recombinase